MLVTINNMTKEIIRWNGNKANNSESIKKINYELPSDKNLYEYYYINGILVKGKKKITHNENLDNKIGDVELSDTILDLDMRLLTLEYLGGSYDL